MDWSMVYTISSASVNNFEAVISGYQIRDHVDR